MAEVKNIPELYKVVIMEHERGWGSKVDEEKYFDNETEAKEFCKEFNSFNTAETVPDWYMVANYLGKVR